MIKKIDKSDLNHKHVNICTKGLDRNLVFQTKMKLRIKEERYQNLNTLPYLQIKKLLIYCA